MPARVKFYHEWLILDRNSQTHGKIVVHATLGKSVSTHCSAPVSSKQWSTGRQPSFAGVPQQGVRPLSPDTCHASPDTRHLTPDIPTGSSIHHLPFTIDHSPHAVAMEFD